MQFLQITVNVVFAGACIVAIVGWFLVVLETISLFRLSGTLCRFGHRVFLANRELSATKSTVAPGRTIRLADCQFRPAGENSWIFGPRFRFFPFALSHNVPVKGTVSWAGSQATIEARIPVGTSVAVAGWLLGWTALGITMLLLPDSNWYHPALFVLWGWVVGSGIYFLIVRLSRHASRIYVGEILQYLNGQ